MLLEIASKGKKRILSIRNISEKIGEQMSSALPALHAISGCDSTSAFYGLGKQKVYEIFCHEFSILKETYTKTGIWFKAKSKLKESLFDIQKQEKQIASLFQTASSIAITASLSYEKLAANVEAKQSVKTSSSCYETKSFCRILSAE